MTYTFNFHTARDLHTLLSPGSDFTMILPWQQNDNMYVYWWLHDSLLTNGNNLWWVASSMYKEYILRCCYILVQQYNEEIIFNTTFSAKMLRKNVCTKLFMSKKSSRSKIFSCSAYQSIFFLTSVLTLPKFCLLSFLYRFPPSDSHFPNSWNTSSCLPLTLVGNW